MAITDDVGRIVSGFMPDFAGFGISGVQFFTWMLIIMILIVFVAVAVYFIARTRKYNRKILIFEKINGRLIPTRKDRATEMKFSGAGDTIFFLLKSKKYLPTPSKQMGKRTYWFFIREDGEFINFELADLDELSKQAGAFFLDKEVRYARTQIQKGLKERYDKPGFWQQYGLLIFSIGYIVIIGVMMWLLFDKWIELAAVTNNGVQQVIPVLEKVEQVLSALENVCQGGSGMIPAG